MWDKEYFQRLWCSCEVAVFSRTRGIQHIEFVPLQLPLVTLMLLIFSLVCSCIAVLVAPYTTLSMAFLQYLADHISDRYFKLLAYCLSNLVILSAVCFLLSVPFFWYLRAQVEDRRVILEQLANYRLSEARVTVESDRGIVEDIVKEHFGTIERFDQYMQNEFRAHSTKWMGSQTPLPYSHVIFGGLGHSVLWFTGFSFPHITIDDLHVTLGFVLQVFCAVPIAVWISGRLVGRIFDWRCSAWLGPLIICLLFGWITTIALVFSSPFFPLKWKAPIVSITLLFTLRVYGLTCEPLRCRKRKRKSASSSDEL
eukprot:TRINITY_DN40815_c0_g1_i1.p1 TRINITY_DN40815_c0_g1~~TRINITY_DN40815_c0_g1_i1.p1  ORF type:complete len:311 (-),score=21.11 TRINITY_DN40815_c0_g1_i1:98-1030(-)